jgi:tRNA1Val (adenine37-N6)-methyltransferase
MEEETLDEILNGRISVYQNKKGYRFSIDALLLAHFIALKPRAKTIELGCGSGVILLILAKRFPQLKFTGLEIQNNLAALAQKNVRVNHLEDQVKIIAGDARDIQKLFPPCSFDTVFFNPPYRRIHSGRINAHPEKAVARHEIAGSLQDFLKAAGYLLKEGGTACAIYPAKRLAELIDVFRKKAIEPKRIKLVFSDNHSAAEFVLAEGKKGSGEELNVESPLFIYDEQRHYTPEMLRIFKELSAVPSGGD